MVMIKVVKYCTLRLPGFKQFEKQQINSESVGSVEACHSFYKNIRQAICKNCSCQLSRGGSTPMQGLHYKAFCKGESVKIH